MRIARTLCFLMIFLALPAAAAVIRPLGIDELIAAAEWVVRGSVQSKTCKRDHAGRIYTEVVLDVSETWKGAARTGEFSIVHSGGIVGEERHAAAGQVQFQLGEEVVVFAFPNQRGAAIVVAMAQGKFTILPDPNDEMLYAENASGFPGQSHKHRMKLAELKAKVTGAAP